MSNQSVQDLKEALDLAGLALFMILLQSPELLSILSLLAAMGLIFNYFVSVGAI